MASLQDRITLFPPADGPQVDQEERVLVFFITGNPGLIEYYRDFLRSLQVSLTQTNARRRNIVFHGTSLLGFELHQRDENRPSEPPYTLRETIDGVKRALLSAVAEYGAPVGAQEKSSRRGVRVVLIGHSVGAYILLEVMEWWRRVQAGEAGPKKGVNGAVGANSAMKIVGGVCLFPTVVDIAMSPRGRWLKVRTHDYKLLHSKMEWCADAAQPVLQIPGLSVMVSALRPAADVTAAWLKSQHGVRQTVFLGRHELQEIAADEWSADVWGSRALASVTESVVQGSSKHDRARLFFLWGEHDHWVDNIRRDRLISRRTDRSNPYSEDQPWMEVDSTGLPHAFCVKSEDTQQVVAKVASWITETL